MAPDPREAIEEFERKLSSAEHVIADLKADLRSLREIVHAGAAADALGPQAEPIAEPRKPSTLAEWVRTRGTTTAGATDEQVVPAPTQEAAVPPMPPSAQPVSALQYEAERLAAQPTAPPTVPPIERQFVPPAAPSTVPPMERQFAPPTAPPIVAQPAPAAMNWESLVGANWLNRIGILILILAGGFLVHLAWQRQWIGPAAQVASVFICGAALLAGGEIFQRRQLPVFAQGLTALGIFALYAGGLVGYHLHHLFTLNATFGVYTAITAASFVLAVRSNSVAVVLLGMLGGYLTPIILSTGQDQPVALFTYLLSLNAAISATAISRRWDFLNPVAFVATALMFATWYNTFYEPHKLWTLETMLSLHAGLFFVAAVFPRLALGRLSSGVNLWMLSQTSLVFFTVTYLLFDERPDHHLGEFAALYGAGHWLLAAGVYALRRGRGDRLVAYLLGLGVIFVTIAVPIYFSGDTRALAWAIQAFVFTLIGLRYRNERTLATASLVFALAIGWTWTHDITSTVARGEWGPLDVRFATTAIVGAMIGAAGLAYRLAREHTVGMTFLNPTLLAFLFSMVANLLVVAAAVHQFRGSDLALVWAGNALIVCALAGWRRHLAAGTFGTCLFLPTFIRFIQWQVATEPAREWALGLDVRFVEGILIVAACWAAAVLIRRERRWCELPERAMLTLLGGDALLMLVLTLQWDGAWLTSLWALNALAIAAFARWQNLHRLAVVSVWAFACVTATWLFTNVALAGSLETIPTVKESFPSGLALVGAGWAAAWLLRAGPGRQLATVLALGMNLVLLGVIADQWDGYAVLALWAIEVAAIWAIGFAFGWAGARVQAMLLWVGLFGTWIMAYGMPWLKPMADFTLLFNPRFGAFAFVGLIGLAAAIAYRRLGDRLQSAAGGESASSPDAGSIPEGRLQRLSEQWLQEERGRWHLVCVVLANLLLVGALTADVNTRFDRFAWSGGGPFEDPVMARQATLSILWAGYAAMLFIAGFVIRYAPIRIMAMVGLAPILLKVFLVDLRNLEVAYRVLSFAVLGMVFVGVSYLYQRYRSRLGLDLPS